MKILHLSIIIGIGIMMTVIGNSNLSFAQDGEIDFGGGKTFIIADTPLKQFKSEISASNVTCHYNFQLVVKAEDNSPACVKADDATKLVARGWALFFYRDYHMQPKLTLQTSYDGIDKATGIVTINNQTYYQTTINYTTDTLYGASIQFHNVTFSFPNRIAITPGGITLIPDIKFQDGSEEIYGKSVTNPDGSGSSSGIGLSLFPNSPNTITVLSNHMNPQAGLTMYFDKIKLLVSTDNQTIAPIQSASQLCDAPYNPKENYISPVLPNGSHTITDYTPILYMPMNSTGKICVHYTNPNPPRDVGIRIFDANNLANDAKDITTSASQNTIPTGNTTIVYTIKTGNMAGFYGVSLFCGGQAFAVGYDNQSKIVMDDFPWYGKTFHCPALSYDFKITGLSGIGIYYITDTTQEQIGYNITGVSVSSVHPTQNSKNVTFTINVRTYNTGAKLWFDYKDSSAIKFIGDPKLTEDSNPCSWIFNNDKSVDGAQWLKLVGGFQVTDNSVTIPSYSNGTYTFSILAKNLEDGWYGLSPIIFSESTNSNIPLENLGGQAIANYYPITMGSNSNLNPSGVCVR